MPQAENPQALNRYAYGLNNPVKYNDPSGHTVGCMMGQRCSGIPLADMSGWSDLAKGAAGVACFFAGCEVDYQENKIWRLSYSAMVVGYMMPLNVTGGTGAMGSVVDGAQGPVQAIINRLSQAGR